MNDVIIQCKNLVLGYDNKPITKEINFEVSKSDYLCIIGENGSGKSTLVKTLLGLNKPVSGSILFLNGLKNTEIGYLPQQTLVQRDFPATCFEIVLSGFQGKIGFRPFYTKEEKSIALAKMSDMKIDQFKNRSYKELSGGQQQRVLLARALCATNKVLLLDEPVAGLDPYVTEEMYEVIEELNKKQITIIMISHDIPQSLKYATHILHIGQKIIFDTKDNYIKLDNNTFHN